MLGREQTSQQDKTSYSLKPNVTFRIRLWDNMFTCFCFVLLAPRSLFFRLFCTVKFASVYLALILLSQAGICPSVCPAPLPQMMEINSHTRSRPVRQAEPPAWGSSVPFEWQTKAQDFCPLCSFPEMPLKICSCLVQSATRFFIEVPFFKGEGGTTRGCAHLEVCAGWCRSPGHTFSLSLLLFTFSSGITNKKKKIEELMIGLKQLVSWRRLFLFSCQWNNCEESK